MPEARPQAGHELTEISGRIESDGFITIWPILSNPARRNEQTEDCETVAPGFGR